MRIELHDGYVRVVSAHEMPTELCKSLTYTRKDMRVEEDSENPYRRKRQMKFIPTPCYTLSVEVGDGAKPLQVLTTMPGFAHRIINCLPSAQVVDLRTPMPKPDIKAALQGLRDYQLKGAVKALLSGGGVIGCPTGWGKTRLMSAILRAFKPEDLIVRGTPLSVVTAYDTAICRQTYLSFKEILPEREIGLVMTGYNIRSEDIQVISLDSLGKLDPADIGILIVDEAHEAASEKRSARISRVHMATRWGASASAEGRFDNSDLVTEGLLGPVVYERTYQQAVEDGALVPIEVIWLRAPKPDCGMHQFQHYKQRETKYRHAVERNPAMVTVLKQLLESIPDEKQTLCIMQHTAQMDALAPVIPSVKYVHAKTQQAQLIKAQQYDLVAVSSKERDELYDEFKSGRLRKIMATYVYKQGVDFPDLSVLIQAGGGGSKIAAIQIPGRASRNIDGKDKSYVIEFLHDWDETVGPDGKKKPGTLLRDDKSRMSTYKKLGFRQIRVDTVEEVLSAIQ